jgi:hypothetical protein
MHPPDNVGLNMEIWWYNTNTEKNNPRMELHVPLSLCPPQTPHGLVGDHARASANESPRLTA